jgi:hypothetical protein
LKAAHQRVPLEVQGEQPQPPRQSSSSQARAQSKTSKQNQKEGTQTPLGEPDAKPKLAASSVGKENMRPKLTISRSASHAVTPLASATAAATGAAAGFSGSSASSSSSDQDSNFWEPYAILDERTVKGVREYRGQTTGN